MMWCLESLKKLNEAREKRLREQAQEEAQEVRAEEAARQHQIKADALLEAA
jgi:hypothetical protein